MTNAAGVELNIGFIPLLDAALPIVAAELGFAAAEGLRLRLVRETSWANIRDRLSLGHFDAAHMLGPMVVSQALGLAPLREPLIAPVALGRSGNAITVSRRLWGQMRAAGATPGAAPKVTGEALASVITERAASKLEPLTFAMVFPFSCHNYELRNWLASAGVDPDRDVRLVVLPPPLLVDALRTGQVDGFCVGEPWNSQAVAAGSGVLAVPVSELMPRAPEKVLAMGARYAERHPQRVTSLVRAIEAASAWAGDAANLPHLAELLSQPRYVGVPADVLQRALDCQVRLESGGELHEKPGFILLSGKGVTEPLLEHAEWHFRQMQRWGQSPLGDASLGIALACFRPDLRLAALEQGTREGNP
jgi:two-component system, oxyanion-binding sensor